MNPQHAEAPMTELTDAMRGVTGVCFGLLRECLGPLEVSAALIESDDSEHMDELIGKVRAALTAYDAALAAPHATTEQSEAGDHFADAGKLVPPATTHAQAGSGQGGDVQRFADAVKNGIADHLADSLPDRKHALEEIEAAVRSVEIRADMLSQRLGFAAPASQAVTAPGDETAGAVHVATVIDNGGGTIAALWQSASYPLPIGTKMYTVAPGDEAQLLADAEDSALLDWFVDHPNAVRRSYGYHGQSDGWWYDAPNGEIEHATDLRDALRAARAATGGAT